MSRYAKAKAHANIALAKYWGKSDETLNLPAVPSLSLTLDAFWTETSVRFDETLAEDQCLLNGKAAQDRELERMKNMLNRVRQNMTHPCFARIESHNNFPTASGLASSASGFAALAVAASNAAQLDFDLSTLSALARQSSASAARSIYGGFVELAAGEPGDANLAATPLQGASSWPICMLVASLGQSRKAMSSTEAMGCSKQSSPYYKAWLEAAPAFYQQVRQGVLEQNLELTGQAMEQSTFAMHACILASQPPIVFWKPATLTVIEHLRRLREEKNLPMWCTMDAGPHVKILCEPKHSKAIASEIKTLPGIEQVHLCKAGPPASLLEPR